MFQKPKGTQDEYRWRAAETGLTLPARKPWVAWPSKLWKPGVVGR